MKTIFILGAFLSSSLWAQYSKPTLVARYSGADSFNAQDGLYCFTSEPEPVQEGIFLGCQSQEGTVMVRWNPSFQIVSATEHSLYSHPKAANNKVSWYEFDETGVRSLYEFYDQKLLVTALKNLGPLSSLIDSFVAIKNGTYIYRVQDESKKLFIWKNHEVSMFYNQTVSHIFPPVSAENGNLLMKIRKNDLNENSPDELIFWNGEFKTVLKDKDADGSSKFKAFRHQYALDGDKVAFIGTDGLGEGIFILENDSITEVARVGKELNSFDYFSPKMKNGVLAFRGLDRENRRSLWVYQSGKLSKLLTQGDVVLTDKGPARVDYRSQDALFYGAPGVAPTGDVYLQATLTDIDSPLTLLGVGLLKFKKE